MTTNEYRQADDLAAGERAARAALVSVDHLTTQPPPVSIPNITAETVLAAAAEAYASAGCFIVPVQPRGKRATLTPHGVKDASCDLATVRGWWANWPTANIGLACGPSGLVVVDLDIKPGVDGFASWVDLGFSATQTATANTGGGGKHLLFSAPSGSVAIGDSVGKLGPGIDVRASGGYIVVAPSVHPSGRTYAWSAPGAPIQPLPLPLAHMLQAHAAVDADDADAELTDPWNCYTLADARKPRPPVEYLVDEILSAGTLNVWFGPPGCMKSLLLAYLAACVVSGQDCLTPDGGGPGRKVSQGGALWIDFDNGSRQTHERFQALADTLHIPDNAPLYYYSMPEPGLDSGNAEHISLLIARIQATQARLVVVDNLSQVLGNRDENSGEIQAPMAGLKTVVEKTGCCLVLIHHQRKSNGTSARAGDTLRGHSSLEAKLDYALLVSREGQTLTVRAAKARGPEVPAFAATFDFTQHTDGTLASARFNRAELPDRQAAAAEAAQAAVLTELARAPSNVSKIKAMVPARGEVTTAALETLLASGTIKMELGRRNSKIYSLA